MGRHKGEYLMAILMCM